MVKNHCFNAISVSPLHHFLASPAVAPEFTSVTSTFGSHVHTVLPAMVLIQLKDSAKLQMQSEARFSSVLSATPHGLTKTLEDL